MRREQNIGKHGQNTARSVLSGRCAINMVEKIGTPVILIPTKARSSNERSGGTFRVIFEEKVSGDHRGIIGNGISVLAETKTIMDRNLRYGDLREHQPGKLTDHANYGGISLLVWVHDNGAYVMRWPIEGFEPGKSITHERAQELNAETIQFLDWVRAQRVQDWNAPIDEYRVIDERAQDNDMLIERHSNGVK